jgi:hypothetical protein
MAQYDYQPRFGPENHSFVVPYELTFDARRSTDWMQRNWGHSFTLSFLYIVVIFGGQKVCRLFKINPKLPVYLLESVDEHAKAFCAGSGAFLVEPGLGHFLGHRRRPHDPGAVLVCSSNPIDINLIFAFYRAVGSNSFIYSICTASYAQGITGFWTEKFAMSKVYSL